MKKILIPVLGLVSMMFSCTSNVPNAQTVEVVETHVLTAEKMAAASPEDIVNTLKLGNAYFATSHLHKRDYNAQLKESVMGQHPMAIVLSCIDSRVPVETIFDQGLGDLFVARVAGNIINPDILGSMEYACEHSGSKVVLVLGHESCGAVHAACEGVDAGNMTQMLAKIKPAIECCSHEGCDTHSEEFQMEVVRKNVEIMVERVRKESEILAHLEHEGKITIVGGIFNLHTGLVDFI